MEETLERSTGFDLKRVANNIRAERARAGLTQEELASLSGVSVSSIRAYESARYCMTLDAAFRITRSLGTTIESVI